jgi:hypothetical protein
MYGLKFEKLYCPEIRRLGIFNVRARAYATQTK